MLLLVTPGGLEVEGGGGTSGGRGSGCRRIPTGAWEGPAGPGPPRVRNESDSGRRSSRVLQARICTTDSLQTPDPRELVPGPATRPRRRDSGRHGSWGLEPPSTQALGGRREGAQLGPRQGCGRGVRWEPAPRRKPRSPRSAPLNPGWGSPPPGPVSAARASRLLFRAPEGRRPRHDPKPLPSIRRVPAPAHDLKSSAPRSGRVLLDHPGLARASAAWRPPRIARGSGGHGRGRGRGGPGVRAGTRKLEAAGRPVSPLEPRNREFSMIGVDGKAANCYMLPDGSRVGPPSLLPPLLPHTLPRSPPALPTGGTRASRRPKDWPIWTHHH
nr:translation initiation factor IF-2 [Pan paniscus]